MPGDAVGSAEEVEIFVTLTRVGGSADLLVHDGYAGEPSVLLADFGHLSAPALVLHQEALRAALDTEDFAESEVATLNLLASTYMYNLGRDLDDLADWNWHRVVRLGTEALVVQTGAVVTAVGGSPISFTRAETFVDVAGMVLGLFHTGGQATFLKSTLEVAGAQSSFLEGEVFNEVLEREGIAAVSALTRAQRAGQILTMVDGSNVDAVLAGIELGEEVENRILSAVASGRIAWVPEAPIDVNRWQGTGYILEDPRDGAGAYLLSGGYAGGADTGQLLEALQDILGDEPWLSGSGLFEFLVSLLPFPGVGGTEGPVSTIGDPINLSTGNLWMQDTDLVVQTRGFAVEWTRTYNSRSTYRGGLGQGWTFTYGEHLQVAPHGAVLYREDDGTEHYFTTDGVGGFVSPPGKHLTLKKDVGGFDLRQKDGLVRRFAPDGRLVSITDRNGNAIGLHYDSAGNLSSITDAAGRAVLTITSEDGRVVAVTDLAGRQVLYSYTDDSMTTVRDPGGETWTYAYDASGNLIARTDPLDHRNQYVFDSLDRCVRHIDPLGHQEHFSYASRGLRAVLTNRRQFDTFLEFDASGRAVLQVDPLGNATRSTWDAGNNRTSTIDSRGGVTSRTFDAQGNLRSTTDPLGYVTSNTYEPTFNKILTVTDANDHVIDYSYDATGNLLRTTQTVNGNSHIEEFSYDEYGQLIEHQDANGSATTYDWDVTTGSLEGLTDALGRRTNVTTDLLGRIRTIEDPAGNRRIIEWDIVDRFASTTDAYGNTLTSTYDSAGRQVGIITAMGTFSMVYDPTGLPVAMTSPLGHSVRRQYDAAGNVIAYIDAQGNTTVFTYDALNRITAMMNPRGGVWLYGYCAGAGANAGANSAGCAAGNCGSSNIGPSDSICEITDPLGNTTNKKQDALGRFTQISDPLGNSRFFAYDSAGRTIEVIDGNGNTTLYEYDELGRLEAVVEANGARTG